MGLAWLGSVAGVFSWLMWEVSKTRTRLRGMLECDAKTHKRPEIIESIVERSSLFSVFM